LRLAGIQIACSEEKERNVEKALSYATIAIEKGAQVICFQELYTTYWFPKEINKRHFDLAETLAGPSIQAMRQLAIRHEVVLICPMFEAAEEKRFYNSAVVIDAGGEILGSYRKVHVPQIPLWEERFYFTPGDLGFPVFKTRYGVIGLQICWDNFFPEGSRVLSLKGAQIIFSPTAAAFASQKKWETVITGNAISNGVYVFRVNRVGREEKQDFYGMSFCVSPEGELLGPPTGMREGIALIDIDLKLIQKVRKEWPFFRDRRPEEYREICHEGLGPREE
jgi:N-carbamoylputrescine amidase